MFKTTSVILITFQDWKELDDNVFNILSVIITDSLSA